MKGYDITVKTIDPQPVASIHIHCRREQLAAELERALPEVWNYLQRIGVDTVGPPFTRYHQMGNQDEQDDQTNGEMVVEAGLPVAEPVAGQDRVTAGELPGGMVAYTWHIGSYDKLPDAYDALDKWIKEKGRQPRSAPWEVYWTDPQAATSPVEWKTEVLWPL